MKKLNVGDEKYLVWRYGNKIQLIAKVRIENGPYSYGYTVAPLEIYYIDRDTNSEEIRVVGWNPHSLFSDLEKALASISRVNKRRMILEIFGRE
jgi:hypothetical protein